MYLWMQIACGVVERDMVVGTRDEIVEAVEAEAAVSEAGKAAETHYGAPFTTSAVVPVATVLDAPDTYVGQTVHVSGRVTDVCQKKGCWMVVTDGTRHLRVMMKDHAFGVDKQGAGADCEVEGTLTRSEKDPGRVAHFEGESTPGAAVPEQSASDVVYELEASGVLLRRSGV